MTDDAEVVAGDPVEVLWRGAWTSGAVSRLWHPADADPVTLVELPGLGEVAFVGSVRATHVRRRA